MHSNMIEAKAQEEETRRLAVKTLEELYCMNCFQLREQCQCVHSRETETPKKEESVCMIEWNDDKPVLEQEDELEEGELQEQEFDIMGRILEFP